MATNVTYTFLGIEMYLLLISWGLISEAVFISLSLCLLSLVFWGLFGFFGPVLVFCLFSTELPEINSNGLNKSEEKQCQLQQRSQPYNLLLFIILPYA